MYTYHPLASARHTRVILLEPNADSSSPLKCRLQEIDLDATRDSRTPYNALSYVWGSPTGSRPLLCDEDQAILVTPNCEAALRRLRQAGEVTPLWVDTVSIDQGNVLERNSQVRMMRDIYAHAERVLVWLGEAESDIDHVLALCEDPESVDKLETPVEDEVILRGVRKLMGLPWWERTWVLQEFVVARADPVFVHGDVTLQWPKLESVLLRLLELRAMAKEGPTTAHVTQGLRYQGYLIQLRGLRRRWQAGSKENLNLWSFLDSVRQRKATDPRDQVFAVFGLLPEEHSIQQLLDYNLSVEEVYKQVTLLLLHERSGLDMLVQAIDKGHTELPSWCIDFSRRRIEQPGRPKSGSNTLSGSQGPQMTYEPSDSELTVRGRVLGRVKASCGFPARDNLEAETLEDPETPAEDLLLWYDFAFRAFDAMSASVLGRDGAAALIARGDLWRAADLGRGWWDTAKSMLAILVEDPDWWMLESLACREQRAEWQRGVQALPDDEVLLSGLKYNQKLMLGNVGGCTMIAIDGGKVGKAEGLDVCEDDMVCTLYGCWKPAVLRRTGDHYKLVTFAWMLDVMDGDAVDETRDVLFNLR